MTHMQHQVGQPRPGQQQMSQQQHQQQQQQQAQHHHQQQQQAQQQQNHQQQLQQQHQQQQQAQQGATRSVRGTPQPDQGSFQSPPLPQPKPLPAHAKSHSIFTPIDDSRSLLAQHWGSTSSNNDATIKVEGPRSQSIDVAAMSRDKGPGTSQLSQAPQVPHAPMQQPQQGQQGAFPPPPQRTASTSSVSALPRPPGGAEAKRPRLKVQIPSEQSDGGSTGADSSPKGTATSAGPTPLRPGQSAVVLPPPSPSANTIMSAGATGPPNPFARPAPPMSTNPHVNREREHIETPLSALPSRVMDGNQMLPSPSTFWSDVWFGKDNNNMMPSPLNFQTPVTLKGPGFDEDERKRKAEEDNGGGGKRPKP